MAKKRRTPLYLTRDGEEHSYYLHVWAGKPTWLDLSKRWSRQNRSECLTVFCADRFKKLTGQSLERGQIVRLEDAVPGGLLKMKVLKR